MLKIQYDKDYILSKEKKHFMLSDENEKYKLQRAKVFISELQKLSYRAVLFPFAHKVVDAFPKEAEEIFYVCINEEKLTEGKIKFIKKFILKENFGPYYTFLISDKGEFLLQTHISKIKKKKRKH